MRKEFLLGKIIAIIIITFTFCAFSVSGMMPSRNSSFDLDGMVQDPLYFSKTYELGAGVGGSIARVYGEEYSSFFFNFTVTNESEGFIHLEFFVDYTPGLADQTIISGQSYAGNFTYAGSYEEPTTYMSLNYMVNIGSNVTFIYEEIVWDHYSYRFDTAGYIAIGIVGGAFVIFVIVFLMSGRRKKGPQL
jgi:hypothetical protein